MKTRVFVYKVEKKEGSTFVHAQGAHVLDVKIWWQDAYGPVPRLDDPVHLDLEVNT